MPESPLFLGGCPVFFGLCLSGKAEFARADIKLPPAPVKQKKSVKNYSKRGGASACACAYLGKVRETGILGKKKRPPVRVSECVFYASSIVSPLRLIRETFSSASVRQRDTMPTRFWMCCLATVNGRLRVVFGSPASSTSFACARP